MCVVLVLFNLEKKVSLYLLCALTYIKAWQDAFCATCKVIGDCVVKLLGEMQRSLNRSSSQTIGDCKVCSSSVQKRRDGWTESWSWPTSQRQPDWSAAECFFLPAQLVSTPPPGTHCFTSSRWRCWKQQQPAVC